MFYCLSLLAKDYERISLAWCFVDCESLTTTEFDQHLVRIMLQMWEISLVDLVILYHLIYQHLTQ